MLFFFLTAPQARKSEIDHQSPELLGEASFARALEPHSAQRVDLNVEIRRYEPLGKRRR